MPLTIIVGMVGFSFLGAGVSRFVRRDATLSLKRISTLGLGDLVLFILSAATASICFFVAIYGGLAVVGGSSSDPSPYVVFALCLLAAVFSEKAWVWLQERVWGQITGPDEAKAEGTTQSVGGEKGAEAVAEARFERRTRVLREQSPRRKNGAASEPAGGAELQPKASGEARSQSGGPSDLVPEGTG